MANEQEILEVVLKVVDKATGPIKAIGTSAAAANNPLATTAKRLLGIAAAGLTIRALAGFMRSSMAAAQEEERAVSRLNASLQAHGNFTAEASARIRDFASSMQAVTTIGDEVTIGIAAQIEALTGLSEGPLIQATQATIQFANVMGTDATAAARIIGKELVSTTSLMMRYGIQVDKTGTQQEQLNQILEATKAGMAIAKAETMTFEGSIKQLKNAWGDLKEGIGAWITQNPRVIEGIKATTLLIGLVKDALFGWSQASDDNKKVQTSNIADILESMAAFVSNVVLAVSRTATAFKLIVQGVALAIQSIGLGVTLGIKAMLDGISNAISIATTALNIWLAVIKSAFASLPGGGGVQGLGFISFGGIDTSGLGSWAIKNIQLMGDTESAIGGVLDAQIEVEKQMMQFVSAAGETAENLRAMNEEYAVAPSKMGETTDALDKSGGAAKEAAEKVGGLSKEWQNFIDWADKGKLAMEASRLAFERWNASANPQTWRDMVDPVSILSEEVNALAAAFNNVNAAISGAADSAASGWGAFTEAAQAGLGGFNADTFQVTGSGLNWGGAGGSKTEYKTGPDGQRYEQSCATTGAGTS